MQHYKTLFDMKMELKTLVATIREEKKYPRANHTRAMFEFRHLHVARCLIKGRTLEEIEGPEWGHSKTGNRLNTTYLQRLTDKWKPLHEAEQVVWEAATRRLALATA